MTILDALTVEATNVGAIKYYYLNGKRVKRSFFEQVEQASIKKDCFYTLIDKTHVRHFSCVHGTFEGLGF